MQKLKTIRAIEPNAGARMSLRNKLIKLNKDFGNFVLFSMMQELEKSQYLSVSDSFLTPAQKRVMTALKNRSLSTFRKNQNLVGFLSEYISKNSSKWTKLLENASEKILNKELEKVVKSTATANKQALLQAGFSKENLKEGGQLPTVSSPFISPEAKKFIQEFKAEKISDFVQMNMTTADNIKNILAEGLETGNVFSHIQENVKMMQGSTERQINNYVLDQTCKVNSEITRLNAKSLGITKAIWKHIAGQYSSRQTHKAFDGKVFNIDEGMFDKDVQKYVKPAELPYCRCVYRLIYD